MRLFNYENKTESIVGVHDLLSTIELPDEHWFFQFNEVPEGKFISVNNLGEPVLVDIS
jgi:hypothetical protein